MNRLGCALAVSLVCGSALAQDLHVGTLEISGAPLEHPSPFAWLAGPEAEPLLRDYIGALKDAADDDSLDKVVIRLKDAELKMTQIEELSVAIRELRGSGKTVHLYCEVAGQPELALGAACDQIILQSGGAVTLPGMFMEEVFLADTLAWIGVKADLIQVGDYKGANEQMTRAAPSPHWDQCINSLLDGLYANLRTAIARGRGLSPAALDSAMEQAWLASGATARKAGIIDAEVDLPVLDEHLAGKPDPEVAWSEIFVGDESATVDLSNPFNVLRMLTEPPSHETTGPTIAIVHIDGVEGCHTYGRSLRQAQSRIREALALWLDREPEGLPVRDRLPKDLEELARRAQQARADAERAGAKAQEQAARAAKALTERGLSRRDAAELLGISHQRVQQLLEAS